MIVIETQNENVIFTIYLREGKVFPITGQEPKMC